VALGGRSARVRFALRHGGTVVPVISLGGHDTLIVLDDGRVHSEAFGLDHLGLERLPAICAWPLGLDACYHLLFPARIGISYVPPTRFDGFAAAAARDATLVERRMRQTLAPLLATQAEP
jgi:hypothetical protein